MRKRVAVVALSAIVAAVSAGLALAAGGTSVGVRSTSLGKILVNGQGRTLYVFAPDKRNVSVCSGSCAHYWPPLTTATKHVTAMAGTKASLLGTTKRKDGRLQVTYNGHPLYRYIGDSKAGETTGQGLNLSGGLWWVVSPAGAAVKRAPGGTTTTTPTTTGGGYP